MTSSDKGKNANNNNVCGKHGKSASNWKGKVPSSKNGHIVKCSKHHVVHHHGRKSESVISTDSDIRFTRRKLGDSQKCGCVVIAAFLIAMLLAGIFVYLGYTYLKPDPLPERVFRGKFKVVRGDKWTMDLADQSSLRFQHKSRDYKERINLVIRRSDLRESFEGSEVLALDGSEDANGLEVLFNLIFDPYRGLVSTADLLAIFAEELNPDTSKYFANFGIDESSLAIKEVTGLMEEPPATASSPLGIQDEDVSPIPSTTEAPPRRCVPLHLSYCKSIGYNVTTYPNLLGHNSIEEVQADVIAFRELVDAECFRQAFDFVCRLLQPSCEMQDPLKPQPGVVCREYCQQFAKGCGSRLPQKFKKYFDCEQFPESVGMQSCYNKPGCSEEMQSNAQSPRLCDGIADCPDLSDEVSCSFCPPKALYCGRGRACVPRSARCDGKLDCPDGADEKDCLSISPLASYLTSPPPVTPYMARFFSEGFAIFSEKGRTGKLCGEGLDHDLNAAIRQTVSESLCRSLGYESVRNADIRNDTELPGDYVKVLDPYASEISFVRTECKTRQALHVECGDLQCGTQSVLSPKYGLTLPKMASPGDWPWHAALFREDTHVCDGTLVSSDWVLTTESCFQGQPKATWIAIFGAVRLTANAPWTQRRRIIGMVKSPVEGSTAALVRLETPVTFSDFIRPICLPDEYKRTTGVDDSENYVAQNRIPKAERLESEHTVALDDQPKQPKKKLQEDRQFFESPVNNVVASNALSSDESEEDAGQVEFMPRAEARTQLEAYPLPEKAPQMDYYAQLPSNITPQTLPMKYVTPKTVDQVWTQCNTLGWSRQRDHLQRVQLKIGDMASCENISIATVNSMCTEATYHKHDCTEEEFAGSPVMCLIPDTKKWALVGIASWRIACAPTGVERPRMYDKITSNSAWIRDTISAI